MSADDYHEDYSNPKYLEKVIDALIADNVVTKAELEACRSALGGLVNQMLSTEAADDLTKKIDHRREENIEVMLSEYADKDMNKATRLRKLISRGTGDGGRRTEDGGLRTEDGRTED